jgi:carbonyl reductase 1
VNFTGVKLMSEAFLPMIDPEGGAIVNCGSGAGPMWCKKQDNETKAFFSNPEVTFEALEARVQGLIDNMPKEGYPMGGYGTSKACLTSYTMAQAKAKRTRISSAEASAQASS